ncbi:MAG: hypothetical protein ACJAX5_001176, partial [Patiriisocius sp.]
MVSAAINIKKDISPAIEALESVSLTNDGDLSLFFVGTGAA